MANYRWDGQENQYAVARMAFHEHRLSGEINGEPVSLHVIEDECGRMIIGGERVKTVDFAVDGEHIWVQADGHAWRLDRVDELEQEAAEGEGDGVVPAPMPGRILELPFDCGATVEAGDVLVRMESMKLQLEVRAPRGGRLTDCRVAEGDMVDGGDILMTVQDPDDQED